MHNPYDTLTLPIIGYLRSPLTQKFGTPRQPNLVAVEAVIEITKPFADPNAFDGIEQFSHLWLIWQFHQNRVVGNAKDKFRPQVRPPRLGGNEKIGVFATRSMYRPANIGLSVVQFNRLEADDKGVRLYVLGADMVDGTPIIDIKPYLAYSDSIANATSGFAQQQPTPKPVQLSEDAKQQLEQLIQTKQLTLADVEVITQLIAQDPRPAYRQQEVGQDFVMRYGQWDVGFMSNAEQQLVIKNLLAI
ncbi:MULTISPECIES: tRNA (N6-threonylcarbamoyladenosine(37)-N6)-methyltransferase TrmO [unclassified Moraxella]|uniref:tRNA (N6-threonylcarbamoyladenosine(37)-N6)-methyltransferase TrmO n=1 Tax=unclassified Moraxella TaxID=2685852 RepID=UPI003AF81A30